MFFAIFRIFIYCLFLVYFFDHCLHCINCPHLLINIAHQHMYPNTKETILYMYTHTYTFCSCGFHIELLLPYASVCGDIKHLKPFPLRLWRFIWENIPKNTKKDIEREKREKIKCIKHLVYKYCMYINMSLVFLKLFIVK